MEAAEKFSKEGKNLAQPLTMPPKHRPSHNKHGATLWAREEKPNQPKGREQMDVHPKGKQDIYRSFYKEEIEEEDLVVSMSSWTWS